jgi:hypothetical protein
MSRAAAVCLALVLSSGPAAAQGGPTAQAREAVADSWIVNETTSPLDYAPVVIASAWSSERADGPAMQLSIQCRRGRTDLVIASSALTRRPEDYRVSYTIDDGQPVTLPTGPSASGTGIAVKDDVVRLLNRLPDRGKITFQVTVAQAAPLEGRYALGPLKTVLDRMAGPCKWALAMESPEGSPRAQPR